MRKIAVAAVMLGLLALAPPASAHETCTTTAHKPSKSPSSVLFGADRTCTVAHSVNSLVINAWRRTPGQSWVFLGSQTFSNSNQRGLSRALVVSGYNCAKEYRTTASGSSTGHSSTSDTSPILQETC